jgi:hypothetical protein
MRRYHPQEKQMEIQIKTITPLWTGGLEDQMNRIRIEEPVGYGGANRHC